MTLNFEQTNRLLSLIEDSKDAIQPYHYKVAYELNKHNPEFYKTLREIAESNYIDEEKNESRTEAYMRFSRNSNRWRFDEDKALKRLQKAYWQISNRKLSENDNYLFDDPYADTILEALINKAPTIDDIEKEFWLNCTDTDKINDFCQIYDAQLKGRLTKCDMMYYSWVGLLSNDLGKNLKYLYVGGFLQNYDYMANMIINIAAEINSICDNIDGLFQKLRAFVTPKFPDMSMSENEQNTSSLNNLRNTHINSFIPKHINEEYRSELEHVFSYGKVSKKLIDWKTGHKEMFKFLKPLYNDETIPHLHSADWIDFVMNNFTKKGKEISKKSLQNEITRQNWA